LSEFVHDVLVEGFCILKGHFPKEKLIALREAFEPILFERIQQGVASDRGPSRYYISLPFTEPFADPALFMDPDILAILTQLAGDDVVMPEFATDTPLEGSQYQVIHRDIEQLSPDMPGADASVPFQFAVNFPLVDVTLDNGPFEIIRRTHQLTDAEARRRIESGEMATRLEPLSMTLGDVMIRDVRGLHRGTPNRTAVPRPMVVMGYNRPEHQRPQLKIHIPQETWDVLPPRARHLLRLNPVVPSLDDVAPVEAYSNLYFLEQ
jgi:ectoine hydroxylase-related dioxygenase (phytanoyl-CoA dioxygenase family)